MQAQTRIVIVAIILSIAQVSAQEDISHIDMVQQLPDAISTNFAREFNINIKPRLISDFASAIDRYQDDFLNSIYDYLKPVVITLIVLTCIQVTLSIVIIILICIHMCGFARERRCVKKLDLANPQCIT
jgi:hypothetical protein